MLLLGRTERRSQGSPDLAESRFSGIDAPLQLL
jgi:hypothetical protein